MFLLKGNDQLWGWWYQFVYQVRFVLIDINCQSGIFGSFSRYLCTAYLVLREKKGFEFEINIPITLFLKILVLFNRQVSTSSLG